MRIIIPLLAVFLLQSCAALVGFGGNPEPSLKRIHMWESHRDFTEEDYDQHSAHACQDDYVNIADR